MVSLVQRIGRAVGFKYDALEPQGKRRAVPRVVPREDHFTRGSRRTGLQSNAADLARNLSLAAWMVRRHLDYVSQFEFHCHTDNEPLNDTIERLMREDSTPSRADVAGRFSREKMFRLAEARRVLDGDVLLVKLADGRMQGVQADLIKDPLRPLPGEEWINGVLVTSLGRPLAYAVHNRTGYTETKEARRINAPNVIHYGFFERFAADQVRGVSPFVSALNPLRDVYENFDYALAKAKVAHIFALSIFRDAATNVEDEECAVDGDDDDDEESDEGPEPYQFDLSKPNILNLDPGDRAEVLESKTPSNEFQNFTQLVIQIALKSLDIPFSFYDEAHTNFFGSRAAWLHYERSCKDRRDDQIEMRRNYTRWKLRHWIQTGRLVLPAGMTVDTVASFCDWVPRGMPWWDPAKEVKGTIAAIAAGLDTPQRACRATGTEFYDNIDEIAKARAYAEAAGVRVSFDPQAEAEAGEGDDGDHDSEKAGANE